MFSKENCHNWQDRPEPHRLRLMPPLQPPFRLTIARPLAYLAAAAVVLASAAPVVAQNRKPTETAPDPKQCLDEAVLGPEKRITACSAFIDQSGTRKEDLADFYVARGD